jgi:hypothetical protein
VVAATWKECAPITIAIPAGKTYVATILSTGSLVTAADSRAVVCSSVRLSTAAATPNCSAAASLQTAVFEPGGKWAMVSNTGVATLTGGTSGTSYVLSTAVNSDAANVYNSGYDNAWLTTRVLLSRPGPASLSAITQQAPTQR